MPTLRYQPPAYRLHKSSGQAVVSLSGRQLYLGKYGTPRSHQRYAEVVADWKRLREREGKRAAKKKADAAPPPKSAVTTTSLRERREAGQPLSLNELILVYQQHAKRCYRKNGEVTREAEMIGEVLRLLSKHHGRLGAEKFGPVTLKSLRQRMIDEVGWSRGHINKQVGRLIRMTKWAVENELLSPDKHAALHAVQGLKKGRTEARETEGVTCVDDTVVEQTLAHLPELVADMVRLQRLTGARPGEICSLKPGEVDRSREVWVYAPAMHKTDHHEQQRLVMIGPKGQEVLRPYLLRSPNAYCFTPAESERRRYEKLAAARKTPPRRRDFAAAKKRALRKYAPCYNADTYRHAVQRTCKIRGIPKWSPNQLRHTAATEIRKRYGIEAAQVVCGHATADVTQVYAERDFQLAVRVAGEVG